MQTFEKRGPSGENNVAVESAPEVQVGFYYGKRKYFMEPLAFLPNQVRTEKQLWSSEPCCSNLIGIGGENKGG